MKKCSKCFIEKELKKFGKCSRNKSSLRAECKECQRHYRIDNKDRIKITKSQYYKKNKDMVKQKVKRYRDGNKIKINAYKRKYRKQRLETDINYEFVYALE